MSETSEDCLKARKKLCFKLAELLEPEGDYDIDAAAKTLNAILPMSMAEADAELEEFRQPSSLPKKPSQLSLLKEAFGVDDAFEAIRRATYVRGQVNACHQVMESNQRIIAELRATLTARESELAEAKRRVAELEKLKSAIAWVRREIEWHANETTDFQMSAAYHCVLEITRVLIDADRITHIPGKEDHDGEMH